MSRRTRREDLDEIEDEDDSPASSGYLLVTLSRAAKTIPGKTGGTRIFHESDTDHPNNGEALVTGDAIVKVYPTQRVRRAIASGLLLDVTGRKQETPVGPDMADLLESGAINPFPEATAPTIEGAPVLSVADGETDPPATAPRRQPRH